MKNLARWTAIISLFTVTFLPLYIADGLFFPFITGKVFAFRILVEVAFAAFLALIFLDRRYRPKFSAPLLLLGLLTVWMAIANAFGVNPHKAFWSNFERMDGWVLLAHLFAFALVAGSVLSVEGLWRRWWFSFVIVSSVVCLYGLVQLGGGAEIHQGGLRLTATLGNAIYLAVYLMFSMMMAAWLAIKARGWTRYLLLAFLPLAGTILFFTASRGPLLGLVAGVISAALLWLFLSRKEWRRGGTVGMKLALGALLGLAILMSALFLARDTALVEGSPILSRVASVFSLEKELKTRTTIWSMALRGFAEDPITGWGQEGFNQIFNRYYEPSLYRQESWFDRVHNMYLDWLVAGGIPALVLFMALLGATMLAFLRAATFTRAERVLLVAVLIAYAVQALVVFDNLFSYVPLVMLLALAHAATARPLVVVEHIPETRSKLHSYFIGGAAGLVAVVLIWTINVPGLHAANKLIIALTPSPSLSSNLSAFEELLAAKPFASQEIREQLVLFAGRVAEEERIAEELRQEFATFAVAEMDKEVAKNPGDARLHVMRAQAYEIAGEKESALESIEEAISLSQRKQTLHINRAFKLYELGRIEESKEAFMYAYQLDPSFGEVAMSAASGYLLAGDVAGAKEILLEAVGTTTPDNDSLFYAYYEARQWNELIGVARAGVVAESGSAKSRYRLAQALAAAGRFAEARAEVSATIAAYPETRAEGEALLAQIPTLR